MNDTIKKVVTVVVVVMVAVAMSMYIMSLSAESNAGGGTDVKNQNTSQVGTTETTSATKLLARIAELRKFNTSIEVANLQGDKFNLHIAGNTVYSANTFNSDESASYMLYLDNKNKTVSISIPRSKHGVEAYYSNVSTSIGYGKHSPIWLMEQIVLSGQSEFVKCTAYDEYVKISDEVSYIDVCKLTGYSKIKELTDKVSYVGIDKMLSGYSETDNISIAVASFDGVLKIGDADQISLGCKPMAGASTYIIYLYAKDKIVDAVYIQTNAIMGDTLDISDIVIDSNVTTYRLKEEAERVHEQIVSKEYKHYTNCTDAIINLKSILGLY